MTTSPVITIQNLYKTYGSEAALQGVDLEIQSGEIFALLGPNGAGKTTTIEILEGHRAPTSGNVSVLGFEPKRSIAMAIKDLCYAFKQGKIVNSFENDFYFNVDRLKRIKAK
mgnify:CR=1 FL=1